MITIGRRARRLPAPAHVVWGSLTKPTRPGARPWLNLRADEVEPAVLAAVEPTTVTWSSLWPSRADVRVQFDLEVDGADTCLRYTMLAEEPAPDRSKTGHLRYRINKLLFADLRYSYGQ
ncbi:hypothetical protein [Nocardia sp. N2S4-5]|uniref:hypothetical protein n=1 Tax=Nocardia sp. N2S4-5 TaxID=3351565 RepID=UPI0037CFDDA0